MSWNIKAVTFTQDVSAFTSYSFKPQLKTLGPQIRQAPGRDPHRADGA